MNKLITLNRLKVVFVKLILYAIDHNVKKRLIDQTSAFIFRFINNCKIAIRNRKSELFKHNNNRIDNHIELLNSTELEITRKIIKTYQKR